MSLDPPLVVVRARKVEVWKKGIQIASSMNEKRAVLHTVAVSEFDMFEIADPRRIDLRNLHLVQIVG